MLYNLVLFLHIVVVIGLVGVILVQRGRSGGLVEALGGVESIFGTKTNSFFVKITVILAALFFITSISLAYLAKARGRSIMDKYKEPPVTQGQQQEAPSPEANSPAKSTSLRGKPRSMFYANIITGSFIALE